MRTILSIAQDLPLLVTSDSILYLVHASFDNTTKDLEEQVLMPELTSILAECQAELGRRKDKAGNAWIDNYRDADLYLTVARHLLTAPPETRA